MTSKKYDKVTGTKVITGNRDVDFVSVTPFEVNNEKSISNENVVNAIACHFPRKILKKTHTALVGRLLGASGRSNYSCSFGSQKVPPGLASRD